jgi:hypothetical protein
MRNYDLVLMVTDPDGERTGKEILVASVRGAGVTGRMKRGVESVVATGMTLGITGPTVDLTLRAPDLIAAALSLSRRAFMQASMRERGVIVAVDMDGNEIPFRYSPDDMTASDVLPLIDEDPVPVPLD